MELQNVSEDVEDLEILVTPFYCSPSEHKLILKLVFGSCSSIIHKKLEEYVSALRQEFCSSQVDPTRDVSNVVKSRTIINSSSKPSTPSKHLKKNEKKIVKRKSRSSRASNKSSDIVFYISLVSLVGFSAVIAFRLLNR